MFVLQPRALSLYRRLHHCRRRLHQIWIQWVLHVLNQELFALQDHALSLYRHLHYQILLLQLEHFCHSEFYHKMGWCSLKAWHHLHPVIPEIYYCLFPFLPQGLLYRKYSHFRFASWMRYYLFQYLNPAYPFWRIVVPLESRWQDWYYLQ